MFELSSSSVQSKSQAKSAMRTMPITKGAPLIGSLPAMIRDPFGYAQQNRLDYGDIYQLDLGMTKAVVLNHPRHAQHILRDHATKYRKGGAMWDFIRAILGNGLVVSEGEFWLRQRRMMQPQFHHRRLADLTDLMVDAIEEAFACWETPADAAAPFNIAPAFNQLTMLVIVKSLFGAGLTTKDMNEVAQAMGYALDYMFQGMIINSLPPWMPFPGKKRFQQSLATFDQAVYGIIADSRQNHDSGNHLLAMLLNTVDEETGDGMDDRQLRDEVATLFLAGYETTSIALSWAVEYLTLFPETLQKLTAEVDQVLGDRRPTFADLPNLAYTRKVLQETMRIRPPSFWVPRVAAEDDEIDGYPIAAGTNIVSLTYMYHRHPDFWPEPDHFDPERFSPEAAEGRNRFAWIPFGAGQRLCIGRDFSLMEGQLALAMLVQKYAIRRAGSVPSEPMLSTTLRPKKGVIVHLEPRADR